MFETHFILLVDLQVCICFIIYIFIHLFPDIVVHIDDLTLFRMDFLRAAHKWRGQKGFPP